MLATKPEFQSFVNQFAYTDKQLALQLACVFGEYAEEVRQCVLMLSNDNHSFSIADYYGNGDGDGDHTLYGTVNGTGFINDIPIRSSYSHDYRWVSYSKNDGDGGSYEIPT